MQPEIVLSVCSAGEKACQDALHVLLDSAQLCRLLKGDSDSCRFESACGDLFTQVAMLHLCAPDPENSLPSKYIRPLLEARKVEFDSLNGPEIPPSCFVLNPSKANMKEAVSPLSESPLLKSLDSHDYDVLESFNRTLKVKDEELLTLHRKLHKLELEIANIAKSVDPIIPSESKPIQTTAAASLIKHGVPIISALALDLDFTAGPKHSLGRGVYSEVYQTTMNVAVKAITGRFSQHRLQQFRQEAEALHLVQGPVGIIRFFGICIDSLPNLFLVTEIADGGSLEALLALNEHIPFSRALSLATSIAAAMTHVHQKNVLHRDLKPSNCMLTQYDTIKLIDFGLARVLTDENLHQSQDGAGTATYQAPEVLERQPIGFESDVYSFAIIMWELVSGKIPFEDLSLEGMKAFVISGERPPVSPEWNLEWVRIMTQCWDNVSKSRPPFLKIQQDLGNISGPIQNSLETTADLEQNGFESSAGETSDFQGLEEL